MSRPARRDRSARAAERAAAADAVSWSGPPTEPGPRARPPALDVRFRRADPRGRGDGHDAVRRRAVVGRPAGGLEPRPPGRRSRRAPRLPRRRFADPPYEHVRGQPPPAGPASPRRPRRAAQSDRRDPASRRGDGRGRGGAGGRRHRAERGDHGAARDARTRGRDRRVRGTGGGPRGGWRRPVLDRDDVRPVGDGGSDCRCAARLACDPGRGDDDVRHAWSHDDGCLAGGRGSRPQRARCRRDRRQLRERPRRAAAGHRTDACGRTRPAARRQAEHRDPGVRRGACRVPHAARDDGDRGDLVASARRNGDRRVLRQHAGPSRGDGRGARRART